MTITISDYIRSGSASENSIKFVRTNSTQAIKKDLTFTRRLATFNAATKTYSIPEYRFVVRSDVADENGYPSGQRASLDVIVRLPVMADGTLLSEELTTIREIINSDSFEDSVIKQIFPSEGQVVESP